MLSAGLCTRGTCCFRNVTEDLSEAHQRWDICGNEDVLNQLETLQDMPLEVKLKPVTEDYHYYQKVTWRGYVGKKNGTCCGEMGALCLYDLAGMETYLVPGRNPRKRFSRGNALPWKLSNGLDSE